MGEAQGVLGVDGGGEEEERVGGVAVVDGADVDDDEAAEGPGGPGEGVPQRELSAHGVAQEVGRGCGRGGRGRGGRRRREGGEERVEGEGHERVGEGQRGVRREAVVGEIDEKDRGVGGEGGGD